MLSPVSPGPASRVFNRYVLSPYRSFCVDLLLPFLHVCTEYCAGVCMHKLTAESTLAMSSDVKIEFGKNKESVGL